MADHKPLTSALRYVNRSRQRTSYRAATMATTRQFMRLSQIAAKTARAVRDRRRAVRFRSGRRVHTGDYTDPAGEVLLPGSATKPPCISYDVPTWLKFKPLQIKGVTFGDGTAAKLRSAVSDFGGEAEVNQFCGAANHGRPSFSYPWHAQNGPDNAFTSKTPPRVRRASGSCGMGGRDFVSRR